MNEIRYWGNKLVDESSFISSYIKIITFHGCEDAVAAYIFNALLMWEEITNYGSHNDTTTLKKWFSRNHVNTKSVHYRLPVSKHFVEHGNSKIESPIINNGRHVLIGRSKQAFIKISPNQLCLFHCVTLSTDCFG